MKKIVSLVLSYTLLFAGLVLTTARPARAQEQIASISKLTEQYEALLAVKHDPATPPEVQELHNRLLEDRRTQLLTALRKRINALRKYQASVIGLITAEENGVIETSIQGLEKDLQRFGGDARPKPTTTAAYAAVTTTAPAQPQLKKAVYTQPHKSVEVATVGSDVPVTGNLFTNDVAPVRPNIFQAIRLSGNPGCRSGVLEITLTPGSGLRTPLTITVVETATSRRVDIRTVALRYDVSVYRQTVNLAVGGNRITVADASGNGTATVDWDGTECADEPPDTGQLVGLLLGGVVISQQAGKFSQADPFFGFNAGYGGMLSKSWRLNARFQGIFQAEAKKDEAPPKTVMVVDPTDFKPFLASRKAFNIEGNLWLDRSLNLGAGGSEHVFWGPYFAWGASTYMDKSELLGDEGLRVPNKELGPSATPTPTPAPGTGSSDTTELDTTRAKIDNDLNAYREIGLIFNIYSDRGTRRNLFLQTILAYGDYEGLEGLYNAGPSPSFWKDSRNRFIGKLRIFPTFLLDSRPDSNQSFMPMFGIELNAGRGPDQLKFFTGVAVPLKKLKGLVPGN